LESLIGINGAFCLVEKKKKEREGRRRRKRGLRLAHRVHSKVGPTVRDTTQMSQVHISFSL
jgi:hypothetical protein